MTPEEYIKAYTRGELVGGSYYEWLTPENALAAVELAREEMKEPASEDLEQAAHKYSESDEPLYSPGHRYHWDDDALFGQQIETSFKAGAEWLGKQMIKDAIETTIDGKVVKVIVIDE